jgi:hypothetical protein
MQMCASIFFVAEEVRNKIVPIAATRVISIESNEVFIGNRITTKESSVGGRLRLRSGRNPAETLGACWLVEADR